MKAEVKVTGLASQVGIHNTGMGIITYQKSSCYKKSVMQVTRRGLKAEFMYSLPLEYSLGNLLN